ncbi:SRPBCC family protein [Mycobacterium sp. DL592]|uniref:SRPBCC family protein n=1 Tax=Mycobacterium sp. DL592 TaxID=2675524 RepID=UPI00141FC2C4|nr:SRPBCC family protein [Mycobacterium sp. DL592]
MVQIDVERTIAAPPEAVFEWLADPANLTTAPLLLQAGWVKGVSEPGVGAVRKAVATGMWFREEITAYDPPHSYSYLIISSVPAFDHEGGTLTFTPAPGGTRVRWESRYAHPVRAGGKVMEALTSRLLPWNFGAILQACATALER